VSAKPDRPENGAIDSAVSDASNPSARPESPQYLRLWCLSLDRLGLNQAIGGFVLGLIALFSSYDHITLAGQSISLQQQWGIPCIAASVATIFTGCVQYGAPLGRDAELASRSRLRAAIELEVERDQAAEERERQAREAQRQGRCLERLDQAALLSGRVQLDPNPTNRARLQFLLTLMAQSSMGDP
jgi:hypothetical protein